MGRNVAERRTDPTYKLRISNANFPSDKGTITWANARTHYPVTQIYFTVVLLHRRREEAGKRLPLGPISPSRILCAAAQCVPESEEVFPNICRREFVGVIAGLLGGAYVRRTLTLAWWLGRFGELCDSPTSIKY